MVLRIVSMKKNMKDPDTLMNDNQCVIISIDKLKQYDRQLVFQLEKYKEDSGRSWEKIAKAIGVNSGGLNLWRRTQYTGNIAAINDKVKKFLNIEHAKLFSIPIELEYCEINNTRRMRRAIESAHVDGIIAVIISNPGLGKTRCAKQYLWDNKVIYLHLNHTFQQPLEWLKKISKHQLLGGTGSGTVHSLSEEIMRNLFGKNILLLVDQADYLNLSGIDILRSITEDTKTGLVLMGLPRLMAKLKDNSPEVTQLRDRIRILVELNPITIDDVRIVLQENWAGLDDRLIEEFFKQCKGSLRILSSLVYNCRKLLALQEFKGEELTLEMIKGAADILPSLGK